MPPPRCRKKPLLLFLIALAFLLLAYAGAYAALRQRHILVHRKSMEGHWIAISQRHRQEHGSLLATAFAPLIASERLFWNARD